MTRIPAAIILSLASTGLMLVGAEVIQRAQNHAQAVIGLVLAIGGAGALVGMVLIITGRRA